ncbi:hypothetical protein SAMN05192555_106126 [Franzmannia pantelleriensis]|uniref:Uncharacterized protein n=1 Tax=Franzmannia pantelleriensis TaxID=48727 RepID=A0A1G9M6D1_9GAMM|nr:hypothetical protein [Halomonas pantelleriensis]SDL69776.1 hypothetical protein SAMN05192555_106126 [Halomonas pantelleriensis]
MFGTFRYRLLLAIGVMLVATLLSGCAARVTPQAQLEAPQPVYLVDHSRHASLVIPHEDGLTRYSYGEWGWYVEGQRGTLAGLSALLWPTPGGLGRKEHAALEVPPLPARVTPEGRQRVHALEAEAERVEMLRQRLDAYHAEAASPAVYSETYGLYFVPYSRDYWAAHQSNLKVVEWLQELGMEVRGSAWLSRWRITTSSRD